MAGRTKQTSTTTKQACRVSAPFFTKKLGGYQVPSPCVLAASTVASVPYQNVFHRPSTRLCCKLLKSDSAGPYKAVADVQGLVHLGEKDSHPETIAV